MNFREQIWCAVSEEMLFETFTPLWSHVKKNNNKKKIGKNPKLENLQFFEQLW